MPTDPTPPGEPARERRVPDPVLTPMQAAVHAAEYRSLAAQEVGLAAGYDARRADVDVPDQRSLLWRTLELAAAGARRRARHYAGLARALQAFADAPALTEPDPVLSVGPDTGEQP